MTISLSAQPAPSNKPKLPTEGIAYEIATESRRTIAVTYPIIDKLTLTLPLDGSSGAPAAVRDSLTKIVDGQTYQLAPRATVGPTKYQLNVFLRHPASGRSVLIQADPSSSGIAFLRFEMNPARLGTSGVRFWRDHLVDFLGDLGQWPQISSAFTVTRIDMACDLVNVRIDSLGFKANFEGKTHSYFGLKGRLETTYMTQKAGRSAAISVYNKKRQQNQCGQQPLHGDYEHTRVEVRVTSRRALTELVTLKNPFKRIDIAYLPGSAPGIEPHHWQHFTDAVRYRGLTAAMAPIPAHLCDAYSAAVNGSSAPLWQPEAIWAQWKPVLTASGLSTA